jgi:hypothetical protein
MKLCSLFAVLVIATAGCNKTDTSSAAPAVDPTQSPATANTTQAANVDPCAFFTTEDLGAAFGRVFAPGKATPGEPSCTFETTTGESVSIALPTAPVSDAEFNSWKQMAGAQADAVSGIGDAAYFWGPRLYVRVGTRTFTISVADKELTPEIRDALTKLGRLGASKLG